MKRGRELLQRTFSFALPQERISERNCGYVVDVSNPQVDVQLQPFVVHKFSSQDRILQCTVEQISRDADRRTVGRCADERVPRQNPAADSVEV